MNESIELDKSFEITSVCMADLFDIASEDESAIISKSNIMRLDESDMRRIASKMADDYCDQLYWNSLRIIVEHVISNKMRNHDTL